WPQQKRRTKRRLTLHNHPRVIDAMRKQEPIVDCYSPSVLRLRWLGKRRDGGDGLWRQWLQIELFREKGDTVAAGFGVQRVRCVIELELLRFAGEGGGSLGAFRREEFFLGGVLQK